MISKCRDGRPIMHIFNNCFNYFSAGGVFHLPPYLKQDIAGLISKMLLVDPMKRATIQLIK